MENSLIYLDEVRSPVGSNRVDLWYRLMDEGQAQPSTKATELLVFCDIGYTSGTTYNPVVIPGELFVYKQRYLVYVNDWAINTYRLSLAHPELALLLGKVLTKETINNMGFQKLIVVHRPIESSEREPLIFCLDAAGSALVVDVVTYAPYTPFKKGYGFVFLAPKEERKGAGAEIGDGIAKAAVA